MTDEATPREVGSHAGLGPLPAYVYGRECGENEKVWTETAMRMYARAAVAEERKRCQNLAGLAMCYAKDADWPRVDAVLGLL
jgi:hypothetical protein